MKKEILIILIITLASVVLWAVLNIVHNAKTSTISVDVSAQILPISPNFDTKTIESLKKRAEVTPIYEVGSTPVNKTTTEVSLTSSASATKNSSTSGVKK